MKGKLSGIWELWWLNENNMTIDIMIGKIKVKSLKEVVSDRLNDYYICDYNVILKVMDFLEVEQCPDDIDGCTEEDTMCPNSAYRSVDSSNVELLQGSNAKTNY